MCNGNGFRVLYIHQFCTGFSFSTYFQLGSLFNRLVCLCGIYRGYAFAPLSDNEDIGYFVTTIKRGTQTSSAGFNPGKNLLAAEVFAVIWPK